MSRTGGAYSRVNPAVLASRSASLGIIAWGDSLTATGSADWYAYLLANPSTVAFKTVLNSNQGVGGEQTAQIKTRFDAGTTPSSRQWSHIFWPGRNDAKQSAGGTETNLVRQQICAMVASLPHTRFRVLEIIPADIANEWAGTSLATQRLKTNADLASIFGYKFIPIVAGLQALGSGAGQDAADVTNGVIPGSLRQTISTATVTGATQANPCVLTIPTHGFTSSQRTVRLSGFVGMTGLNGLTAVFTVIDANTISIAVNTTAFGAYVSGGSAALVDPIHITRITTAEALGAASADYYVWQQLVASITGGW